MALGVAACAGKLLLDAVSSVRIRAAWNLDRVQVGLCLGANGLIHFLVSAPVAAQQGSFLPLGVPATSSNVSSVGDISSDGHVIVGKIGPTQAFRWTAAGGLVLLGQLPGGAFSGAGGTSLDGNVVVGQAGSPQYPNGECFHWMAASGMIALGNLPGALNGAANGLSLDGSVAVGVSIFLGRAEPIIWTPLIGLVSLGGLPGQAIDGSAFATNADGSVVVGRSAFGNVAQAFRWTAQSGMTPIGLLPGADWSSASDVSADGNVIVGRSSSTLSSYGEAFRWTRTAGMVGLGDLPTGNFDSHARSVSASGLVVVGYGRTSFNIEAVFWDPSGAGPIRISDYLSALGVTAHQGWVLVSAEGVSADGLKIIGNGINPAGQYQAWLATFPEPWSAYCTAKVNSLGCTPAISAVGVPSASNAWSFHVHAASVLNQTAGLFFYKVASSSVAIPFQGGTLCVGPTGIRRTPVVNSGGNPSPAHDCSGTYTLDMNAFAHGELGGNPDPALLAVGNIYRIQAWGRDQGFAPPNNTSLSNALQVPIGP